MTKALGAIAFGICALSAPAYAYNQWNINASSCTADAGAIRNDLYIGTGGTVKFGSGKMGDIVLYCPVPKLNFTPTLLAVIYYDDTFISGNHVTAQLIRMDMSTGLISRVVTADSDRGPVSTNGNANYAVQTFVHNYDSTNYAYYIRIDIVRNLTTANETVYAVALQN
jgi:hypothetical protein